MSTQELMKYDLMAVLTEGKPGRQQNKKRWIAQIVRIGFYGVTCIVFTSG